MTREIELSQGKCALVDDEDYERVMQFTWCASRCGNNYYAMRPLKRSQPETRLMHRFILNAPPEKETDHINGDGLDNRRANLRLCTHAENLRNRPKMGGRTSQHKGVCWHKKNCRWAAYINVDGARIFLGYFVAEKEAYAAYCAAAAKYHGVYGRTE